MMKYQSSTTITISADINIPGPTPETSKANTAKYKCKLTPSSGTITNESCNWIEFIFVAHCQMTSLKVLLHTRVHLFRPIYKNSFILPHPIQTEWFEKRFVQTTIIINKDICSLPAPPLAGGKSRPMITRSPLSSKLSSWALRLESRRTNPGRNHLFRSSLIPPLMTLPENSARGHLNWGQS